MCEESKHKVGMSGEKGQDISICLGYHRYRDTGHLGKKNAERSVTKSSRSYNETV